jgi:hypothetical protein
MFFLGNGPGWAIKIASVASMPLRSLIGMVDYTGIAAIIGAITGLLTALGYIYAVKRGYIPPKPGK